MKVIRRTVEGLGDAVFLEPLVSLASEKFSEKIGIQLLREYLPLYENHPKLDKLFTESDDPNCDFLLDTNKDIVCPALIYEIQNQPEVKKSRVEIFCEAAGLVHDGRAPKLYLSESERREVRKIRRRYQGIRVGIHTKAKHPERDYPHIKELIEYLRRKTDWHLFLIEKNQVLQVPGTVALTGLPIRKLMTYIKAFNLVIGPDSGIVMLAGALNTPVYGIFGPTDPKMRIACFKDAYWKEEYTRCARSPCWYESCEERWCLKTLSPKKIYKDVNRLYELQETVDGVLFDTVTGNRARGFGDLLITTALLPALKRKYNKVIYAVREPAEWLLSGNRNIDKLITKDNGKIYKEKMQLKKKIENYSKKINRQPRIDAIAEWFGIEDYSKKPELRLTEHWIELGRSYYAKGKINVAVNIETTNSVRSWRPDYFCQVIEMLSDDFHFHVFGTEKSMELSQMLPEKQNVSNHIGDTSLQAFVSAVRVMDFVIGCDSLIAHIAGAFDIPALILYTEIPKEWRCKYYSTVTGIQSPVRCSPCWARQREEYKKEIEECYRREVQGQYAKCITALTPSLIIEKFTGILKDQRTLIKSSDGLGDLICSLPLANHFGEVDYQVQKRYQSLFDNLPYIKQVIPLGDRQRYVRVVNFSDKMSDYYCNRTDALFEFVGIDLEKAKKPQLVLSEDELPFGKKIISKDRPNVAIAPVAVYNSRSYTKLNLERLIELLNEGGYQPILIHDRIIRIKGDAVNLTGKTNIRELMSVISAADVVITVDTAALHIAGALDTPVVLLASTKPPRWLLKYYQGTSVMPDIDCFPCLEEYPRELCQTIDDLKGSLAGLSVPCMQKIQPEKVVEKTMEILE